MKDKELEDRLTFIEVYRDFNSWLHCLGFKMGKGGTFLDYNYSHFDDYIDSMYGVEHYEHPVLKLSIRFLRDNKEHKFMFVGDFMGGHSEVYDLNGAKEIILTLVKDVKHEILKDLNSLIGF